MNEELKRRALAMMQAIAEAVKNNQAYLPYYGKVLTIDYDFRNSRCILVDREVYILDGTEEHMAYMAKGGLFGNNYQKWGARRCQELLNKKFDERRTKAKEDLVNLWGQELAEKAWHLHSKDAHRPEIVEQVVKYLNVEIPELAPEGIKLADWLTVTRMVKAMR